MLLITRVGTVVYATNDFPQVTHGTTGKNTLAPLPWLSLFSRHHLFPLSFEEDLFHNIKVT